jgi:hypothetical protein
MWFGQTVADGGIQAVRLMQAAVEVRRMKRTNDTQRAAFFVFL